MKIYAAREQYENELDKYVGEDIWVLVDESYISSAAGTSAYIKILDVTEGGDYYLGYRLNADYVDWPEIGDYYTPSEVKRSLKDVFTHSVKIPRSSIAMVDPAELVDTEDFIYMISNNIRYINPEDLYYLRQK